MYGLLMRPNVDRCQDGFCNASSQHVRDGCHQWVPRSVSRLRSIDHTICSSSKLRPQRAGSPPRRTGV